MSDVEKFHSHLDICEQCRENPTNLCPVGSTILKETAEAYFELHPDNPISILYKRVCDIESELMSEERSIKWTCSPVDKNSFMVEPGMVREGFKTYVRLVVDPTKPIDITFNWEMDDLAEDLIPTVKIDTIVSFESMQKYMFRITKHTNATITIELSPNSIVVEREREIRIDFEVTDPLMTL